MLNKMHALPRYLSLALLLSLASGCALNKPVQETHRAELSSEPYQEDSAPVKPATETYDSIIQAREVAVLLAENATAEEGELSSHDELSIIQANIQQALKAVAMEQTLLPPVIISESLDIDPTPLAIGTVQPDVAIDEPSEVPTPTNIWNRIRDGYGLKDRGEIHKSVASNTQWYAKHQKYLDRTFNRAQPYLHFIVTEAEKRNIPLEIVLLPVVESAFQPFAYSHGRASGIWQFIPGTGRHYGLDIDWWYDGRRDIKESTLAALTYLERLHKLFDGDWLLALAAYNSGEGTVGRAIRKNKKLGKGITFWDLKLPKETRGYVPKLLAISNIVADPEKYKVSLIDIPNEPYLTQVDIGSQLDLALAAEMAGLSLEDLYVLNPGFNRWATPPDGPHALLLPIDKAEAFKQRLAQLPKEQRVKWVRHKIGSGETLGHIAKKYNTTVGALQRINEIRNHVIRAGKHLLIPVASRQAGIYALSEEQRLKNKQNIKRQGTKITHKVRSGDTFWDLSQQYKVSVASLAKWNNMAPRDMLRPNQTLVIWTKDKAVSSKHVSAPNTKARLKAAQQKIRYKVRQGDSLARISQRFNVPVNSLLNWNPKARGKYIQPGQMLIVYVDITKVSENI